MEHRVVVASEYKVIQPPFTLKFREMSKKELKEYLRWFLEIIPDRIQELTNGVRSSAGFESWSPDFTPVSLDSLGAWFGTQVETRPRSPEELDVIRSESPYEIEVPERDLTNRTFSLAMNIGMYLSQVLLRNHPSLKWNQPLGSKRFADYGQPVLIEFSYGPLNCVHIVVTLAYGIASGRQTEKRLRELYDIWAKAIKD